MKIQWMGHACFLIELNSGIKILTDPYEYGAYNGAVKYLPVSVEVDIVTISHHHADHNCLSGLTYKKVVDKTQEVNFSGVEIEGYFSYHDKSAGNERGENIMFLIQAEGINLLHCGDLGTIDLDWNKINKKVDILFVPVGGVFTIDAQEANKLVDILNPSLVIPMHFKTSKIDFNIAAVDSFLQDKKNIEVFSVLDINKSDLPEQTKIALLEYQR